MEGYIIRGLIRGIPLYTVHQVSRPLPGDAGRLGVLVPSDSTGLSPLLVLASSLACMNSLTGSPIV